MLPLPVLLLVVEPELLESWLLVDLLALPINKVIVRYPLFAEYGIFLPAIVIEVPSSFPNVTTTRSASDGSVIVCFCLAIKVDCQVGVPLVVTLAEIFCVSPALTTKRRFFLRPVTRYSLSLIFLTLT